MDVAPLLQELIRIPSVNPESGDDCGATPEQQGEKRIALRLAEILTGLGAKTRFEEPESAPGRPNLIAEFPSDSPGKPKILLGPHSDTVGVQGMTIDPFGGELRDGRIWGRGASDTKGTMAAMIAALARIGAEELAKLPCEIHFVAFCAEETAQHGSIDFGTRHGKDYRFAVIGEPTDCKVVNVHKGCTWGMISVPGKACHGSLPEQGVNAITRMGRLLEKIDTEFRELLISEGGIHPVLGHSTVNIGTIEGGSRANIVPDFCRATVDLRSTPQLDAGKGAAELIVEYVQQLDPEAEFKLLGQPAPCLDTSSEDPYALALGEAGHGLTGAPWFCDAARLAAASGLAAVAAGPGSIEQAHTADEWIEVQALEEGVDFYESFLRNLPVE